MPVVVAASNVFRVLGWSAFANEFQSRSPTRSQKLPAANRLAQLVLILDGARFGLEESRGDRAEIATPVPSADVDSFVVPAVTTPAGSIATYARW